MQELVSQWVEPLAIVNSQRLLEMGDGASADVSPWVRKKMAKFSKVVGVSIAGYEKEVRFILALLE